MGMSSRIFENLGRQISEKNDERKKHMKRWTKLIYSVFAVVTLAIGVITANAATGDIFVSDSAEGVIYKIAPDGTGGVFVSGLGNASGLAFDSAGYLFAADENTAIYKIAPDGTRSIFANGLNEPYGLAFDSAGYLFEADLLSGTIYKFAPDGTRSTFAIGLNYPTALAFDSAGNLFEADSASGTIYKFTPDGTQSTFATGLDYPYGLAFDSAGYLFEADLLSGTIYKFAPDGTRSTFATGLNYPVGLAFDDTGYLFEADHNTNNIYKFASDGTQSLFYSGLPYALYIAIQPPAPIVTPTPTPTPSPTVTPTPTPTPAQANWDAARDLILNEKPDQPDPGSTELLNPNGRVNAWSYGYRATPAVGALTLFAAPPDEHSNAALLNHNEDMEGWQEPGGYWPIIAANVAGQPVRPSPELQLLDPSELYVHPGDGFTPQACAVVRWTAPYSSTFSISATWRDIDWNGGDGFGAHMVVNGTSIYDANPDNGGDTSFTTTLSLVGGDLVDFVVDPGIAGTPTPTPTATATPSATPTPTATPTATPAPPRALKATNVTASGFTANWSRVNGAIGCRLDVSTSASFANYVPGYQNLDVGNTTSRNVTGLRANTTYYYRLRAYNGNGTSLNSNVIKVKTKPH